LDVVGPHATSISFNIQSCTISCMAPYESSLEDLALTIVMMLEIGTTVFDFVCIWLLSAHEERVCS
jgi:hypothetical protein